MSDPVTALHGRSASGTVRIVDAGPRGMVTLRGDLSAEPIQRAAGEIAGVMMPEPRRASLDGDRGLLWMAPDEVMLLCPYAEAAEVAARLGEALSGTHHLAANVSDARAVLRLDGDGAALRDTLAKVTPADLRASVLPVGEVRRTRLAQVAGAFWFREPDQAEVMCFRSVAAYVFDLLDMSARKCSEPGHF